MDSLAQAPTTDPPIAPSRKILCAVEPEPRPSACARSAPSAAAAAAPASSPTGPPDRNLVALTFDDGPSDYTDDFLRVLREKDAEATFFEVGQAMPGHQEAMGQNLAQGSEIGDHTMDHVELPDYAQIAGAAARLEDYTRFRPCLFRPPGSIVVMHDGGGPRGETLAALPRIVDTLRGRGYRFATVSELHGGRMIHRPQG
ncbi:MAG TPA: polysaccharide deacetylase family protein [Solirubrobacterales bacterium]|nr:polysaccharide deacetylase family protein [Solirubrobacterales bacterium]